MSFKIVIDGYIVALSNWNGAEVTETEYNTIMQKIQSKPSDPDGYVYKLRADNMEWELVELPKQEPVEEDADISDYENALAEMGVRFGD